MKIIVILNLIRVVFLTNKGQAVNDDDLDSSNGDEKREGHSMTMMFRKKLFLRRVVGNQ